MKPIFIVLNYGLDEGSEDALFAQRALALNWGGDARIWVGFDVQSALASLPADAEGGMLVLNRAWLSLDGRCLDRLSWGLSQGLDVAFACDSVQPGPMAPASYATAGGMTRFVNACLPEVHEADAQFAASVGLGTVAGWRRYVDGAARVGVVAGAWAHDSTGYFASAREEMLPLVPAGVRSAVDVGGGEGGFLAALKAQQPQVQTQLVELTEGAAAKARGRAGVDAVWVGDFLAWAPDQQFDCISFLDVIEHMVDPERALHHARSLLSDQGCVVLSIPNVGHWSVVADLLEGRWDWAPAGIHCYTHVRFFTRQTIEDMLRRVGLRAQAWLPIQVPCRPDWLAQWQTTPGLTADADALGVYAYGVRAVVAEV